MTAKFVTESIRGRLLLAPALRDRLASRLSATLAVTQPTKVVRRVTLVMCSLILDGASLQTLELSGALGAKGVAVTVICPRIDPEEGFLRLRLPAEQVARVVRPSTPGTSAHRGSMLDWTREAISDSEPDVVLFYGLAWLPAAVDHTRKRVGVVQVAHHEYLELHLPALAQESDPVDAVVCVSDSLRRALVRAGVNPAICHTIWNGIAADRVMAVAERGTVRSDWGFSDDEFVVGYLGRLVRPKGVDLLLHLLEQPLHPALRFVVIGGGAAEGRLRRQIAHLGLERRVLLSEARADVGSVYGALDAVIHPSRTEGLPLTVVEAMHAGVPIVARPSGGVPEVLEDGVSGLLAYTPAEFAEKVGLLASSPGLRTGLAYEAAAFARRWLTAEVMAERYIDVLEGVVESLTPRGPRLLV